MLGIVVRGVIGSVLLVLLMAPPGISSRDADPECDGRLTLEKHSRSWIKFKVACSSVSSANLGTILRSIEVKNAPHPFVLKDFSRRPSIAGATSGEARCYLESGIVCSVGGTGPLSITGRLRVLAGARCDYPFTLARFAEASPDPAFIGLFEGRPERCKGKRDPAAR